MFPVRIAMALLVSAMLLSSALAEAVDPRGIFRSASAGIRPKAAPYTAVCGTACQSVSGGAWLSSALSGDYDGMCAKNATSLSAMGDLESGVAMFTAIMAAIPEPARTACQAFAAGSMVVSDDTALCKTSAPSTHSSDMCASSMIAVVAVGGDRSKGAIAACLSGIDQGIAAGDEVASAILSSLKAELVATSSAMTDTILTVMGSMPNAPGCIHLAKEASGWESAGASKGMTDKAMDFAKSTVGMAAIGGVVVLVLVVVVVAVVLSRRGKRAAAKGAAAAEQPAKMRYMGSRNYGYQRVSAYDA